MSNVNWTDQVVLKTPKSISDQIYEYLKKKIRNNEIEGGVRLIENQIAKSLKASRTPVREAFRRLEQDSLVSRMPQGGVMVTTITSEEIQDVFGIRGVLESYAVKLACQRIAPQDIAKLKDIRKKAVKLIESDALEQKDIFSQLFHLNTLFHETIYKGCGSYHLEKTMDYMKNIVLRSRAISIRDPEFLKEVWNDHKKLITYLEQKNEKSATQLMEKHIQRAASFAVKSVNLK